MQQLNISLPDHQMQALTEYCRAHAQTPEGLVSTMLASLTVSVELTPEALAREAERRRVIDATFGAWAEDPFWKGRDSVEYVRQLRAEWDRPEDRA